MLLYNHMAIFACIARERSFTAAAEKAGMPKSTVSLRLKELEEALGVRLIQRTTRQLTLTDYGRLYYEQCVDMLDAADQATGMMQGLQEEPRGILKVSCPFGMSESRLPAIISVYTQRYPLTRIQVLASNERANIVKSGIDIALRLGELEDSSLIARKIKDCSRWILASKAYIDQHGAPEKPGELHKHRCIVSGFTPRWGFQDGKTLREIAPEAYIRVTDVNMAKTLAVDGVGICMLPDLLISDEIDRGLLIPLLPDFPMPKRPLNLVYPSRKLQSASIKRFIETTMEVYSGA